MSINIYLIMFYTLLRREVVRMLRISSQVFLPPVITTSLYFFIFGSLIGGRIGNIQNVSYAEFIAPGLIMMTVITNSYGNVSSSLFSLRFQKSIEEMLVSPIPPSLLLAGFIVSGVLRGLMVGALVYLTSLFFIHYSIYNVTMTVGIVIL
ncbi:MAG: ABC transporter permease, partial [Legionellaceae bacterium]|nr:ABC transporter permease [Legionellaceae bacterium]